MRRQLAGWVLGIGTAAGLGGCAAQDPNSWDPKMLSVDSIDPWRFGNDKGWKINTPHYVIYTTIQDEQFREKLPQVMEGAFAQYRELAPGVAVSDKPMACYVFYDRMEWNAYTKQTAGTDARIYLQIRSGGYTIGDRYVSYYIGPHGTASVAAHEGWHQFVARNFKGRLPPFLEEGLATTFEGVNLGSDIPRWNTAINPLRATALRHAVEEKHLWPTEQLISMHAGQVVNQTGDKIEAFYAQCWCFAKFLREADNGRYAPALQLWLAETAAGTVFDPSHSHTRVGLPWNSAAVKPMLEHYLGMSLPEIDQQFQLYMRHVAFQEFSTQWELSQQ
jgi:hypothetical protein